MARQVGMFDVEERLSGLSKKGDDLERLAALIDFELFRAAPERAVPRADRSHGGRPPFGHVLMFKALILQTQNSDERTEFYLRDRLTRMRFLGLGLGAALPDANRIWTFREALTKAGAIERWFGAVRPETPCPGLSRHIRAAGGRERRRGVQSAQHPGREAGGQGGPRAGRMATATQRSSARRTATGAERSRPPGPSPQRREPAGRSRDRRVRHQNRIGADRWHRLIRRWLVTDAAAHAGTRLADRLDPGNPAAGVGAYTGYRSIKNEDLLRQRMLSVTSTGRNPWADRCRSPRPGRTRPNPPSGPTSSTSSPSKST
jgi:IS5 family transposase